MFDKKIRFIQNGLYVPEVGRVYHGKEIMVSSKVANSLISSGYAEYASSKVEQTLVEYEEKKEENVEPRKPKTGKKSFKNKS